MTLAPENQMTKEQEETLHDYRHKFAAYVD